MWVYYSILLYSNFHYYSFVIRIERYIAFNLIFHNKRVLGEDVNWNLEVIHALYGINWDLNKKNGFLGEGISWDADHKSQAPSHLMPLLMSKIFKSQLMS